MTLRVMPDCGRGASVLMPHLKHLPLVLFALVGFAHYAGSFALSPGLSMDSDTTITLSRALAGLYPGLYASDFLFDASGNYDFYNNASVGFFQLMEVLGAESPEHPFRAFRLLGGVATFVFLAGYYFLALHLTGSRVIAFLFACACSVAVTTFPGDYWGLFREPQARLLFSALLPFVLLLALRAGTDLRKWIMVFVLAGVGVWLHPASGPPAALALMVGMLAANYSREAALPLLRTAFVSGLVFLAIALPNILQYLAGVRTAVDGADAALAQEAFRLRFAAEYLTPLDGIATAFGRAFSGARVALIPLAVCGFAMVARTTNQRTELRLIVAFLLALLAITCGVPAALHALTQGNGQHLDLVRSIRMAIPLLLLGAFWGAARLPLNFSLRAGAAASITLFWFAAKDIKPSYRQNANPLLGVECWLKGEPICRHPVAKAQEELLAFIRNSTAPGARFFSPDYGLSVRSLARRPLAFDWKDLGWIAYSNQARLVENLPRMKRYLEIRKQAREGRFKSWLDFGRDVGADYVVVTKPVDAASIAGGGEIVFNNRAGSVVALQAKDHAARLGGLQ